MEIVDYLRKAVESGASDLFVVAGGTVSCKVKGQILGVSEQKIFPDETERLIKDLYVQADRDISRYIESGASSSARAFKRRQ